MRRAKEEIMLRIVGILLGTASLGVFGAPSLNAASGNKKLPVPPEAAQAESRKLVKDIFGTEYAKADTPAAKQALAKKLLESAKSTADDPSGKFVLLKLARDVATQALDGMTAFQAVDEISETFEVDPVEMKAAVLKQGATHATLVPHHKRLLEVAMSLVDPAITEDNYAVAKDLCDLAAGEARSIGDSQARTLATDRAKEVQEVLSALYEKSQNAAARLLADPVNPEANTAMGKYLCFVKGDWDHGILMLALCNDETLKSMAEQELIDSPQPDHLGDAWWDLAEKEEGTIKRGTKARAAYWYRQALSNAAGSGLTGLAKARVEKRLGSLADQSAPSAVVEQPAEKQPEVQVGEHNSWTVPYTWSEQVKKYKTVDNYSPQTGHVDQRVPYMATVKHYEKKKIDARLVSFDYKTGNVVLKIIGETKNGKKEADVVRSFRYAALSDDDKKFLDSVRRQQTGQK
jgi:hypothetical protein